MIDDNKFRTNLRWAKSVARGAKQSHWVASLREFLSLRAKRSNLIQRLISEIASSLAPLAPRNDEFLQ